MSQITLLDLPILPMDRDDACGTSVIIDTYLAELGCVNDANALIEFVKRWRNIWLLESKPSVEEIKISQLTFDPDLIFGLVVRLRNKDDNFDYESEDIRIASTIAIPLATLKAFLLSSKYGVGSDLGFVRLYLDPYPEHENDLRG